MSVSPCGGSIRHRLRSSVTPVAIKQIFTASPERALAGRGNVVLKPILGENSVLLLDGARHKRERKLLMPPFQW